MSVGEDLSKAVWHETQNLTSAQRSAARNNIQAADQMTVDFHSTQISDLETGKQDKLTFDSTPTAGSSNPVTSAGIKTVTDALAGDVDDLKSAIDNIDTAVAYTPTLIQNRYRDYSTGVAATNTSYYTTTFLPVKNLIGFRTKLNNNSAGVSFYDADLGYLDGFTGTYTDAYLIVPTIPANAEYIVISCSKTLGVVTVYYTAAEDVYAAMNGSTDEKYDRWFEMPVLWKAGKYVVASTGELTDSVNFNYTDFLPIHTDTMKLQCGYRDAAGIAFYDADRTYISGATNQWNKQLDCLTTIIVPSGAKYFRASEMTTSSTKIYLPASYRYTVKSAYLDNSVTSGTIIDRLEPRYEYYLQNVLCIGDSLTESYWHGNGNPPHTDVSYPQFLAKFTGATVTNAGKSGYSASNWYTEYSDSYTYSQYKDFIIWLGTNNGLTDTLSTDVTPYTNYNDFAETETGYYCKIISKIISQKNTARIYLGTVWASNGDVDVTNNVIHQIAALYPMNVVGVAEFTGEFSHDGATPTNHTWLHPYDGLHFGTGGNLVVAEYWTHEIRRLISQGRQWMFARYNSPRALNN